MAIVAVLFLLAAATTFDESYRAGLQALAQNRLSDARANLEQAAKLEAGSSRVWLALAQTYWKLQEPGKANDAADRAAKLAAGDAPLLRLLAFYYDESGQRLKACDMQTEYAVAAPADGRGPTQALDCFLEAQAPERAILASARGGTEWRNRADVRYLLAKAYQATRQWALSDDEFRAAIRLNPYEESYHLEFASSLLQRHEFEQAIQVIAGGKKNFDKSPQLELELGAGYYGLRRFAEAAASFQRTIALSPDLEEPYIVLGKMLDQVPAKLPELTRIFEAFEQAHPDNYLGYLVHAKALAQRPDSSKAAEVLLKKACLLSPQAAEPHFELAVLEERQQRLGEAAAEFEQAALLVPRDPATHYHLARVYDRLGKSELAKRERDIHKQLLDASTKAK